MPRAELLLREEVEEEADTDNLADMATLDPTVSPYNDQCISVRSDVDT